MLLGRIHQVCVFARVCDCVCDCVCVLCRCRYPQRVRPEHGPLSFQGSYPHLIYKLYTPVLLREFSTAPFAAISEIADSEALISAGSLWLHFAGQAGFNIRTLRN
jgi:hypothetical protein